MSFMNTVRNRLQSFSIARDERGLSTVEYVILLVLIAALCVGTWNLLGTEVKKKLNAAGNEIQTQTSTGVGDGQIEGTATTGSD